MVYLQSKHNFTSVVIMTFVPNKKRLMLLAVTHRSIEEEKPRQHAGADPSFRYQHATVQESGAMRTKHTKKASSTCMSKRRYQADKYYYSNHESCKALSNRRTEVQCILDYPAMLGNLFPKSWLDKKSIYRRVPTVHHLHHT